MGMNISFGSVGHFIFLVENFMLREALAANGFVTVAYGAMHIYWYAS